MSELSDLEYVPSAEDWVRDQVDAYERTGGRENLDTRYGRPIVLVHVIGAKSGKLRKMPVMRVEHGGVYAIVASLGGAPQHPKWYHNVKANPRLWVQDGPEPQPALAREIHGEEKRVWWERAVTAFPHYQEYQDSTDRELPVLLLEPRTD